jgi:MoaA/NifB/PqqE/SkfB family radical SAM enzyme
MTVTTNGTVPLADMVDSLRHLQALRISMEGHKADIHERLRQSDLGEIVARGQALARAGVPIVARCTLSRTNWASLREMVGTFSEWGFDSVQFFEFQAVGRGQGIARGFALGTEEIRQTLETLQELAEENWCPRFRLGLPASRLPIVHEVLGSGQTGRLRATPKLLPRNSLTIDCNGDLGICPWQVGKDARANLRDTDLADFIETAGEQGALLHRCAHCSAIHLHNGSDPHARSLSSAISALPDGRTSDATA